MSEAYASSSKAETKPNESKEGMQSRMKELDLDRELRVHRRADSIALAKARLKRIHANKNDPSGSSLEALPLPRRYFFKPSISSFKKKLVKTFSGTRRSES